MATYHDLRLILLTLKIFGLFSTSYERERRILRTTRLDEFYANVIFCLTQIVMFSMLIYCLTCPTHFFLGLYNRVGNIYLCFDFSCSCVLLAFISGYLYKQRLKQLRAVRQLLNLDNNKPLPKVYKKRLKRVYGVYVFFALFCCQNYTKAFWFSYIPIMAFISYSLLLTLNFAICGLIMVWYIHIQSVIKVHFINLNRKLENLVDILGEQKNRKKFRRLLKQRYVLLSFCRDDINSLYGIIMMGISAYILMSSPAGIFFLISVVFERSMDGFMNNYNAAITSSMWNLPWLTIFIWTLSVNNVDDEANKTAKILSKIPRTGTGIERMVQKFLLKNLRQKPILTAYGFFSLDKSTLFKLFTAIFTYMVILVQFKEMENSRKQLGETGFNETTVI